MLIIVCLSSKVTGENSDRAAWRGMAVAESWLLATRVFCFKDIVSKLEIIYIPYRKFQILISFAFGYLLPQATYRDMDCWRFESNALRPCTYQFCPFPMCSCRVVILFELGMLLWKGAIRLLAIAPSTFVLGYLLP